MSRLYDRVLRDARVDSKFKQHVETATVISVNNVVDYYVTHDGDKMSFDKDIPNVAPPFSAIFFESHNPRVAGRKVIGNDVFGNSDVENIGMMVESVRLSEYPYVGGLFSPDSEFRAKRCEWVSVYIPVVEFVGGRILVFDSAFSVGVLKDGALLRYADEKGGLVVGLHSASGTRSPGETPEVEARGLMAGAKPFMLALSFMHCKNVEMVKNVPPDKLSKKVQQRYGRPPVTFHTLHIEPMKKVLRTEGGSASVGLVKALHICRGHFRDYRERGLFGKAKGVYWFDAHVRGSLERGVTAKDYSVASVPDSIAK